MNMKNARRSEDTEQISVMQWAERNICKYPELKWLHHCPNGGSRNSEIKADGGKIRCIRSMPAISERGILRTIHRNEIWNKQPAASTERVSGGYGGGRALCGNMLFCSRSSCSDRDVSTTRTCQYHGLRVRYSE